MALGHLTDAEIQDYVDGLPTLERRRIDMHLESCQRCEEQVEQYKTLFEALSEDVKLTLSANFSQSIIHEIKQEVRTVSRFRILPALVSFLGLTIAALGLLNFTTLQPLTRLMRATSSIRNSINLEWSGKIVAFLSGLDLDLSLLGVAVFVVFLMSLIDHFVFQSKPKLTS